MTGRPSDILADRDGMRVLAGSMALMAVLGSIHAFSVFLTPIEATFGVTRSDASLTYSLGLAVLTVQVLFGHRIYRRLGPPLLVGVSTILGAGGAVMAAYADGIGTVWLGYGVMFGAANGLGYGFCLQFAAQANPEHRGVAMGLVTAAYGLGAAVAPLPLDAIMTEFGYRGGMLGLAAAVAVVGPMVAAIFARSGKALATDSVADGGLSGPATGDIVLMWSAYGAAVAAGLMAIGHATGIAYAAGLREGWVVAAPVAIAAANVTGSCLGGYLIDIVGARRLLQGVAALSAAALIAMTFVAAPAFAVAGLAMIGFSYGATIAAFPAAIGTVYGPVTAIRAYGRVFTAWGVAGLFAPWIAGFLYERSGDYASALILAAILAASSLISLHWFPSPGRRAAEA